MTKLQLKYSLPVKRFEGRWAFLYTLNGFLKKGVFIEMLYNFLLDNAHMIAKRHRASISYQ